MSVLWAILDHPDFAVALDDLCFDLTDLFVDKRGDLTIAADDLFAGFDNAVWAQRICHSRKAQRRFRFLPRLEDRFVRPFRNKRWIRFELIDRFDRIESAGRKVRQSFFKMFYRSHS